MRTLYGYMYYLDTEIYPENIKFKLHVPFLQFRVNNAFRIIQ